MSTLVSRLSAFFMDILEVVVFAIAIFLFVYLLVMQPHKIKGTSMEPNFPDGQYLLTDKISYRFKEPERGQVIVFEAPGTQGEEFIKRIIALPGERVKLENNTIYINGERLDEDYLSRRIVTEPRSFLAEGQEVTVPERQYFVLGDNRPLSSDSRTWGFVSKEKITGKAWFIYWPPPSVGTVEAVEYSIK